jgi:hypothetical protein
MNGQEAIDARAKAQADLVARRPEAETTFRELTANKKVGRSVKDQAARLKDAREVLIRTGGIPID